ncbi:MAG: PspC domain-containing protein [Bacteroidales bacterium]|nr:PspC domain-containing protein [Candidatus Equimonas faecalis]
MKRNFSINLFGTLYNIDEDAFELLKQYEDNMRHYFSHEPEGAEICNDIECRVAELLSELKAQGTEAVSIEHVQDIIRRIGDPAEWTDSAEGHEQANPADTGSDSQGETSGEQKGILGFTARLNGRKLYRDPDNKVLGGVMAGLAQWSGKGDPTLWRIVLVLLLFFSFSIVGIIYLVLWAVIPEARTAEDRLRMRGEDVTPLGVSEEVMRMSEQGASKESTPHCQSGAMGCLGFFIKLVLIAGGVGVCLILTAVLTAFAGIPLHWYGASDKVMVLYTLLEGHPATFYCLAAAVLLALVFNALLLYGLVRLILNTKPLADRTRRWLIIVGVVAFLLTQVIAMVVYVRAVASNFNFLNDPSRVEAPAKPQDEYTSLLDPGEYQIIVDGVDETASDSVSIALYYQLEGDSVRTPVAPGEAFTVDGGMVTWGASFNPQHRMIGIVLK